MQHNDSLLRAQLSHSAFEFQRFINRSAHESFDLGLTKRCKYAASKATNKTLGPREAHPIALVGAAVENLDSLRRHHPHQLHLAAAFVIVISQHRHRGHAQPNQRVQEWLHLRGLTKIREDRKSTRLNSSHITISYAVF